MRLGNLDLPSETCRLVGDVLGHIGNKWAVFIIVLLKDGSLRFSQIERNVGTISKKMLTLTLRDLERDGFVTRTVTPIIPPRVDYELTPLGRDVLSPLSALADWALANREEVERSRRGFDARVGAG
jgi:DNA-binding HxlR family transcriptional regulator